MKARVNILGNPIVPCKTGHYTERPSPLLRSVTADRASRIIQDADRCVKCAVCLPYCPTYAVSGNEAESPRGRIALARALADGSQDAGPGLSRHLDQCLACRNCEPVCPAGVPYGRLLDETRAELAARRRRPTVKQLGLKLVARRGVLRGLAKMLRLAQLARLDRLIPAGRRLPRLSAPTPWRDREPRQARARGTVGLFVGCVADILDAETRDAAARVLAACGYRVHLPPDQTCCGALHLHAGDTARARALAASNARAFGSGSLEAVVSTATGCGAQLHEHVFPAGDHADVCLFLASGGRLDGVELLPLEARVAVHVPCTQRNVLGNIDAAATVLARIPGLTVQRLAAEPRCCGAAGSYVLEHSGIADRLGRDLAQQLAGDPPDYLATPNIGCAMHLADHLRRLGANTEVLHPVTLLARQLRAAARIPDG